MIGEPHVVGVLELVAGFSFAISGVLAVAGREVDWFGAVVLGVVTAIGGGTLRGLILGVAPVFWIQAEPHLLVAVAGSAFAIAAIYALGRTASRRFEEWLELSDAAGLAMFSVLGAATTLQLGFDAPIAILMGLITAVGGGVIRDVMSSRTPLVLQGSVYATAALAGSSVYVVLEQLTAAPEAAAAALGIMTTLALRLLGIYRGWRVPLLRRSE